MKEYHVTYYQAVKLKELGFDGNGFKNYIRQGYYKFPNGYVSPIKHDGDGILVQFRKENAEKIPAPRLDQAQKWLREVKGVEIVVEPRFCNYKRIGYDWHVYDDCSNDYALRAPLPFSETYELALSAGIAAALELLTDKLNDK